MLLYAETHYPKYWLSLTRRREPEILADLPWRVESGRPVPVLLAVRDAHRYPVRLDAVEFAATVTGVVGAEQSQAEYAHRVPLDVEVTEPWWWRVYHLKPLPPGRYDVSPVIRYTTTGRGGRRVSRRTVSDNYRGTLHTPFELLVASDRWPTPDGWLAGDAHVHTDYTRDQVEFGPPVAAIGSMSRAMGIGWAALTDHSYDLDDAEDDYLVSDRNLPRWKGFSRDIADADTDVRLIRGEEVSCGNSRGENIHLLALAINEFIPGSGDSGERAAAVRPDLTLPQAIDAIHEQGGLAVAAHIGARPSWVERITFRRGTWNRADIAVPGLDALQVWNGRRNGELDAALDEWVRLLLAGRRIPIVAGNDSHGSFGRSRAVVFPWISLRDDRSHLFGHVRTVARAGSTSPQDILEAVRRGACYLTDGPELLLSAQADGVRCCIGDRCGELHGTVCARARSTDEFGGVARIGIGFGFIGEARERWTWSEVPEAALLAEFELPSPASVPGYVRAEVRTTLGHSAISNPIWFTGAA